MSTNLTPVRPDPEPWAAGTFVMLDAAITWVPTSAEAFALIRQRREALLVFHDVQVQPASWLRALALGHGTRMLDLDPRTGRWACFCTVCLAAR